MKCPAPVTIDFETFGIDSRPFYPPIPVGVSIKKAGKAAKYFSWGHPSGNNCTKYDAVNELKKVWDTPDGLLFQNGKFDLDVAETHLGLPFPKWDRIHDTMFLLFLDDPNQTELGLKPSAHRLLGWAPDEQDAVGDWLVRNQPVEGVKISKSKGSPHYFGRYIAYAPGNLVGKYANGDTERTHAIFRLLWPKTQTRQMLPAYDRERELMPILLEMERAGLRIDRKKLSADVALYLNWRTKIDAWIIKALKAGKDINLDSGDQLISAMIAAKKADPDLLLRTPTGKFKTSKDALFHGVTDRALLSMLKYRSQLKTCINTFMCPWLELSKTDGRIYTSWNQIKSPSGDHNIGTRTGRLSATWFMNIPKEFTPIFHHEDPKAKLPKCPIGNLPPLPKVRSYIIPFEGDVFIDRDYSQQEPRILGHFDGGALMEKYIEDPWIDFHDYAKAELEKVGKFYDRKPVKNTNLGLIYGMGVGKLAERNDMPVEEANDLKKSIMNLYPGLRDMYKDMKVRAKNHTPIRTWGGREVYCEEPKLINGRIIHFDYKMVNYLIQGSAADSTKEAIIRYHRIKDKRAKIVLNVHDQITASVPKPIFKKEMEKLRQSMESVEFDVPILSEGSVSVSNWDDLQAYDKKGRILQ